MLNIPIFIYLFAIAAFIFLSVWNRFLPDDPQTSLQSDVRRWIAAIFGPDFLETDQGFLIFSIFVSALGFLALLIYPVMTTIINKGVEPSRPFWGILALMLLVVAVIFLTLLKLRIVGSSKEEETFDEEL